MADFYIDGDMAPLGRLNYVYQNYIPDVSTDITPAKVITVAEKAAGEDSYFGSETTDTDAATDPESAVTADPETDPETETDTEAEAGCKAIAGGMMMLALLGTCAIALDKKKD